MKRKRRGGYVYLFERISFRSLKARLTRQREIKIGISNKPARRLSEVDKAVKGKVVMLQKVYYDNPRKIEKRLHEKFKSSNFRPATNGLGGGVTEWFLIDRSEFKDLKRELGVVRGWFNWSMWTGVILILLFFLYLYLKTRIL